jgi:50S ribosomal subunit-associated GTPase HflX
VERGRVIEVFNKSDLVAPGEARNGGLWVSAAGGEGLGELRAEVARRLGAAAQPPAPAAPTGTAIPADPVE